MMGDALAVGEGGLGLGACDGMWGTHLPLRFLLWTPALNLRKSAWALFLRVACPPLLRTLETISSVSIWGIECCFGFL